MTTARIEAQAKVNLFLRILGREPDGYHQIETLLQRIALADTVVVRTGIRGRALECRGADCGPTERNLAWRAALAYAEARGWPDGFAIEIEKGIPVGGGLGGGSADAGAVLRALNAMSPAPLDDEVLFSVARALGADVPFLASDTPTAVGLVRGDVVLACPPPPPRDLLLFVPPFGVASAEAYAWYADAHRGEPRKPARMATPAFGITISSIEEALNAAQERGWSRVGVAEQAFTWSAIETLAGNDLQEVVVARHPEIARAAALLRAAGARVAQMTGSGSAVFGVFDGKPAGGLVAVPTGFTVLHSHTVTDAAPVQVV